MINNKVVSKSLFDLNKVYRVGCGVKGSPVLISPENPLVTWEPPVLHVEHPRYMGINPCYLTTFMTSYKHILTSFRILTVLHIL
jgi:hypothetical protein